MVLGEGSRSPSHRCESLRGALSGSRHPSVVRSRRAWMAFDRSSATDGLHTSRRRTEGGRTLRGPGTVGVSRFRDERRGVIVKARGAHAFVQETSVAVLLLQHPHPCRLWGTGHSRYGQSVTAQLSPV